MSQLFNSADHTGIATIRTLAADVVGKANSGHPGAPMGMAPVAHVLFTRFFNANPSHSKWFNRDRFVLSNGCALQYILLHLLGYKLSLDDLKAFRQLDSLTPGHPEAHHTDGIEVTTGPLGQGFSNGVGFAIAQAHLGAVFNRENFDLINNYTYVFTGDGCLMEGVASEAASLAGHLQLGNLIVVRTSHVHISIDGDTAVSFTEDVTQRFLAYGWQVIPVEDGDSDLDGIYNAIATARREKSKPTLIRLRTTIGYGSKQQGTHGVHGSPLKADDIQTLKAKFGFPPDQTFHVPVETYATYRAAAHRGAELEAAWTTLLAKYGKAYPKEHAELTRRIAGDLPDGWEKSLPVYKPGDAAQASRKYSEIVLTAITPKLPDLLGGSADLTGSNLTKAKGTVDFQPPNTGLGSYSGHISVMVCVSMVWVQLPTAWRRNWLALLNLNRLQNFVSYAAGAVRLSALSKHQVIWVATHDSIGLGEDGPTHQPVETAAHFRAIPNLDFWRPADGNETSASYLVAIQSKETPSILSLSRQNLPNLEGSTIERAARGGYVLYEVEGKEDLTIVSSGSEVPIALEAASKLKSEGVKVRIVSLPCWSVFDKQDKEYRLNVLRSGAPILSLEALSTQGWQKYSHEQWGLPAWGSSGPYQKVYEKFGITGTNIAAVAKKVIGFYQGKHVVSPLEKAL
ncbi:transketolase [Chiua virens]|nr:transketolase [Chiua virens]